MLSPVTREAVDTFSVLAEPSRLGISCGRYAVPLLLGGEDIVEYYIEDYLTD